MAGKLSMSSMKGYPDLPSSEKINTVHFLNASREVVATFESFGKLFKPVVYDMNGNIEKIQKHFVLDKKRNVFLDDMLVDDAKERRMIVEPLLWLKRALEMIEAFFTNVHSDDSSQDDLRQHIRDAYKCTLQPFHGWIVQEAFSVIYRWIPTRSQLFGHGEQHAENMKHLEIFLQPLRAHLQRLNNLYTAHSLHSTKKV
ncbi:glycolipid transfer protein [Phlebotomus argentipes]|uniref:glycolipid transfer protein n=1 Tax=Phlebotomus argentipes TaxID=94469 RepID=UPI0028937A3A|nr:glycolipid transfer protein [Phlebotomus argentipes]